MAYDPGPLETEPVIFVASVVPAAGKLLSAGITGSIGIAGVPKTVPPLGAGPTYVLPAGRVTIPVTEPPPILIFPFTSILPVIEALDPTDNILPAEPDEFAAVILPLITLLLVIITLSPE